MFSAQTENFGTRNRTIKHNHLFLVDDVQGNIPFNNFSGMGLYNLDTRFLSCFEIRLHDTSPIPLLSSTEMGYLSTIVFTNGPINTTNREGNPYFAIPETIQLKRETVLYGSMFERFSLISYHAEPIHINLSFAFDADFKDMFDIRDIVQVTPGPRRLISRERDGEDAALAFIYNDRSGRFLQTRIRFIKDEPLVEEVEDRVLVTYKTLLNPRETVFFDLEIQTLIEGGPKNMGNVTPFVSGIDEAIVHLHHRSREWERATATFVSDNQDFNEMMARNNKDIHMLMTHIDEGSFVAAGIPWYVALFGRDSLITSRFCLPLNPEIAKDSLRLLAKYQGKTVNPARDEEPGKILHELRMGELARLGEIPHTPYYGSVDATALWIITLYDYFLWTNDRDTLVELWPNALAAMEWINGNLARYPLGYATYDCQCENGILQQGWKDSHDSVMYDNGVVGKPPLALSEVQGYIYQAKRNLAKLAEVMDDKNVRQRMRAEAQEFRKRFNREFWIPELDYCALGLDIEGRPFKVISSNPGHCLETGILNEAYAFKIINRLMTPEMFNGWGLRTLSSNMAAYNPMSYHNGSVWPHDNAMIAKGFAALDRPDLVEKIFTSLFEAARHMFYKRLPELFCGFRRDEDKPGDPPVRYAVACSPQAWAAASMYSLIQSMLNLKPDAQKKTLKIRSPKLPTWMNYLQINNLRVGNASVDLEFRRTDKVVTVDVRDRRGDLDIILEI